ncbi:hypothetical protein ACIQ6Y_37000 [Streptomyces sp. NPDC096205]|uniref:hypothetical protein n=1 Tax=Streptomyces sp. NPDC096205 TaxID=3366081 RepID=UPI003820DB30
MPFPSSPRIPSGVRRRTLFASAAGGLLVAGCSSGSEDQDKATGGSPAVGERVRVRAAADSADLVERYDAVLAAHPALAGRVRPLREETARHVTAFGGVRHSPTASPSASPSVSAPAPVPGTPEDALAGLAAAERGLADRRAQALLGVPGELARLLASVAAAGAAHAYLLTLAPTEGHA